MVSPYLEMISQQVDSPLLYGVHDCQEFLLMGRVILLSLAEFLRGICDGLVAVSLILCENSSNGVVGSIRCDSEGVFSVWARNSQDRGLAHPFLEFLESL